MTPSRRKPALVQRAMAFKAALLALCLSTLLLVSSPAFASTGAPTLSWAPCPAQRGFECATAKVPLDHRNLGSARLWGQHLGAVLCLAGGRGSFPRRGWAGGRYVPGRIGSDGAMDSTVRSLRKAVRPPERHPATAHLDRR